MVSRREVLAASLSLFGASRLRAADCNPTVETSPGPFYPKEPLTAQTDLTQANGGRAGGDRIYVFGQVLDANCNPVPGAVVDMWQADIRGNYKHPRVRADGQMDPHFGYFTRLQTDAGGAYFFKTIAPPAYGSRPAHLHFMIQHKGMRTIATEMQFAGEAQDRIRARDWVMRNVPESMRAGMIVAGEAQSLHPQHKSRFDEPGDCYRFNIQLTNA